MEEPAVEPLRACRGGDRDGRSLRAELEVALVNSLKARSSSKKTDLAVGLAAELQARRELRHRRIAHDLALHVHATLAIRAADADTGLADRREQGIAIGLAEELAAFARVEEDLVCIVVRVGPCGSDGSASRATRGFE
jgi:hypothetical protein